MRKVTIEKINDVTIVTVTYKGKTSTRTTSKSWELEDIPGGVQILPNADETTFNNEKFLLSELTDNFGCTTGIELVKKFAELGFFKEGGGVGNVSDDGCFHLKGNTLKMCNLDTQFNSSPLGLPNGLIPNRMQVFIEFPDFKPCNIRATLHIGFTKLFEASSNAFSLISPFKIHINSTIIEKAQWLGYTKLEDKYPGVNYVTLSEISTDLENNPNNLIQKLKGKDLLDTPENLKNTIAQLYAKTEPLVVKSGTLQDGRKGLLVSLPKDIGAQFSNSMFVHFSELEITFDSIDSFDEGKYKNFPKFLLTEEKSLGTFTNSEIKYLLAKPTFVVLPPFGGF